MVWCISRRSGKGIFLAVLQHKSKGEDDMKVIYTKSYAELSEKAAELIAAQVQEKAESVLGLATGSTPIGTYDKLIEMNKAGKVDFSKVTSINLDEYVGLTGEHDQSYRYFMNDKLFNHVNINKENTNVPNGVAEDIDAECKRYDALIEEKGGIDLQLLGIGHNGHIGFNEPCDIFEKNTHKVQLGESTIQANARFFGSMDEVPKEAVTMGIQAIMLAKKVLLIANGPDKKDIIEKAVNGPVTPQVPASILQFHPDVTVICCFE